jgi:hypothetical protein
MLTAALNCVSNSLFIISTRNATVRLNDVLMFQNSILFSWQTDIIHALFHKFTIRKDVLPWVMIHATDKFCCYCKYFLGCRIISLTLKSTCLVSYSYIGKQCGIISFMFWSNVVFKFQKFNTEIVATNEAHADRFTFIDIFLKALYSPSSFRTLLLYILQWKFFTIFFKQNSFTLYHRFQQTPFPIQLFQLKITQLTTNRSAFQFNSIHIYLRAN